MYLLTSSAEAHASTSLKMSMVVFIFSRILGSLLLTRAPKLTTSRKYVLQSKPRALMNVLKFSAQDLSLARMQSAIRLNPEDWYLLAAPHVSVVESSQVQLEIPLHRTVP